MGSVRLEHSDLAQHRAGITQQLRKFWREGHLCDVVLKSCDGTVHRAHKAVLSAASSVFWNLLGGSCLEAVRVQQGEHIEIAASKAALSALLDYIYEGQPEVQLPAGLELMRLAQAYDLPKLAESVEAGIRSSLDSSSAMLVLQQAHGLHSLKEACEEKVAADFETCSQHSDFGKLSDAQLARILKRDDLGVSREEVVLKGIFTWLNASPDRNCLLGMLLQHVDFQSLSVGNLLRLERFNLSGQNGENLHREVSVALRKRTQASQTLQPKRRRLQHWSPDLGASEASGHEVLPFACFCLRRHGGDIYATDFEDGRILCWKHGDAAASVRTLVDAGTDVCGMNLQRVCDVSISPSGELFVADYLNRRLVRFQGRSGDIVLGEIDLDMLFVSPQGLLHVVVQKGQTLQKLVGSALQTVIASESLPPDLQFEATAMFVTNEEVIYVFDKLQSRILRINAAEPFELVVVGQMLTENKPLHVENLFVTEGGTIYVTEHVQRKVLAFHPGNATFTEVLQCPVGWCPVALVVQERSLYLSMRKFDNAGCVYEYLLPPDLQLE